MKTLYVNIISYKNNNLFDLIESLKELSSGKNNIIIKAIYQHPRRNRKYSLDDFLFIKMDDNRSPLVRLGHFIKKEEIYDYYLLLGAGASVQQDWDDTLIKKFESLNVENITSGYILSTKDNYADANFLFMRYNWVKYINFPNYLKRYGFNEEVTMRYYCMGYDFIGFDNNPIIINNEYYIDYDYYIPFSPYHNYQEVADLYENGYNNYSSLNQKRHMDFKNITNNSFIKKLNFVSDDVDYGNKNVSGRNAHFKKGEYYRK